MLQPGVAPLVGRAEELLVLEEAVAQTVGGAGGALALTGAAGVGKSRLARYAVSVATASDLVVLTGRAVPGGTATPYRPLVEALAPWARTRQPVDLGAHTRALDVLVPGWGGRTDDPVSPVFVAEALLQLVLHLTEGRPALLLIDDLHWADEETLAAVEYLADAAPSLPLLLVLTSRDDEAPAADRLLRALSARGAVRQLPLGPLDLEQTRQLAEQQLARPVAESLCRLLVQRTDGLPLFVEELLQALVLGGGLADGPAGVDVTPAAVAVFPTSVADTVGSRLDALPEREVVESAALLGRSFDHELLEAVHGAAVPGALRAATDVGLLHEDPDRPGRLRFRHALLRDGVLASTFPPSRAALARRLLDLLLQRDLAVDDLLLATELATRAGDAPLATRLAVRRAVEAYNVWALTTAEQCLAEARHYAGTDPELLNEIDLQQLRVASLAGRHDVVDRVARAMLGRPEAEDTVLIESHLRLAQALLEDDRADEAEEHLAAAAPIVARSGDDCTVTRLELEHSTASLLRGDPATARVRAAAAADLARPFDDQVDLVCAALLHEGRAWLPDDPAAARACWTEGLRIADAQGFRLWRGRLLTELATSDAELREAEELAVEAGAVELLARVRVLRARHALLRGDLDEVESLLPPEDDRLATASRRTKEELRSCLAALHAGDPSPVSALAGPDVDEDDLPLLAAVRALERPPAREPLLAAVATFDRLGLTRAADACRALLRADGVPLPRRATAQDGVPEHLRALGVTTRELDVLRLLAEGRTNRDVAGALYLSPRTVEKHVERLLLKTGAGNRTALAALLRVPEPTST